MFYNCVFFLLQGEVWRGRGLFSRGCQGLSPEEANVVGASPLEAGPDIWFLMGVLLAVGLLKIVSYLNLYSLGLILFSFYPTSP